MTFSLSTICTHVVLCGVLLVLMSALTYAAPCLDKPGRIWVMTGCVLLAVRMLLPFEWKVTKTIYISRIYPEITCFFNQTIQLICPLSRYIWFCYASWQQFQRCGWPVWH